MHLSVAAMVLDGQPKFTGIVHDLTSRVRMEEQLREQAALAKLGEMAAVVAHEVKNPLAGIRGAIQVFAGRLPETERHDPIVGEIIVRIDSLDQTIKDLLLYARPLVLNRAPTDVVALVSATARLLAQDPAWHDVRVDIDGASPPIVARR
jgi:signal transduction histidine kinase